MQWRALSLGPDEEPNPRGHVAGGGGVAAGSSVVVDVGRAPYPIGHVASSASTVVVVSMLSLFSGKVCPFSGTDGERFEEDGSSLGSSGLRAHTCLNGQLILDLFHTKNNFRKRTSKESAGHFRNE